MLQIEMKSGFDIYGQEFYHGMAQVNYTGLRLMTKLMTNESK